MRTNAVLTLAVHLSPTPRCSLQDALPPLPEDARAGGVALIAVHEKLSSLRYNLDRARLIAERVRRYV